MLINSVVVGALFLAAGLGLYSLRQWGDGDAWLLGAMGFLYPDGLGFAGGSLPFPLLLLFNFFFVAFFYIIAYSLAVGVRSSKTRQFFRGFRRGAARIAGITIGFTIALGAVFSALQLPERLSFLFLFSPFLLFLLVFLEYGKFVEQNLFRRKVPVRSLRKGDVPVGEKWRVLDAREVAALRRRGGKIWIKEGVRFAPVFFLTVLLLLARGDIWPLLASLL